MTKRQTIIGQIRFAGYHNDMRTAMRYYVEGMGNVRVSFQTFQQAWRVGKQWKENGEPCSCFFCSRDKAEQAMHEAQSNAKEIGQ